MRRTTLCAVLTAIGIVSTVSATHAGFILKYSEWRNQGPQRQINYAEGLMDGHLLPNASDPNAVALSNGLNHCGGQLGLNGNYGNDTAQLGDADGFFLRELPGSGRVLRALIGFGLFH